MTQCNQDRINKEEATEYLKHYWDTYDRQHGYKQYTDITFLNDALYGIGVAMNRAEYEGPSGWGRFKALLLEHLEDRNASV